MRFKSVHFLIKAKNVILYIRLLADYIQYILSQFISSSKIARKLQKPSWEEYQRGPNFNGDIVSLLLTSIISSSSSIFPYARIACRMTSV